MRVFDYDPDRFTNFAMMFIFSYSNTLMEKYLYFQDLSYKEKHWHESCFVCSKCRTSLVDKQFGSKADRIYCGPCYDAQFASRCDGCGDVFRAGKQRYCGKLLKLSDIFLVPFNFKRSLLGFLIAIS